MNRATKFSPEVRERAVRIRQRKLQALGDPLVELDRIPKFRSSPPDFGVLAQ